MAMMEDSAPCSPAAFKMASSKGISDVTPSRENRFEPRYRACRTCSKRSARISRSRILRSEEHTSELQSHHDLVCRLLLEKKKINRKSDRGWHERTLAREHVQARATSYHA